MKRFFLGLLLFGVLLPGTTPLRAAGDRIWTALVLGTNEALPAPVPEKIRNYVPALERVFGYNSFDLLGRKKRDLVEGHEVWLKPTKELFLGVRCLERGETFYKLRIELYRGKKLLLTTEARLSRQAPLYIRGPRWGDGQLIFVLEVR